MRISDWSSDVCSSDLPPMDAGIHHEDIIESLASQARDAILGHEQAGAAPDAAVIDQIVNFELHLSTAQLVDRDAGKLNADSGMGGEIGRASCRERVCQYG